MKVRLSNIEPENIWDVVVLIVIGCVIIYFGTR